jgi:hypothetical protein
MLLNVIVALLSALPDITNIYSDKQGDSLNSHQQKKSWKKYK